MKRIELDKHQYTTNSIDAITSNNSKNKCALHKKLKWLNKLCLCARLRQHHLPYIADVSSPHTYYIISLFGILSSLAVRRLVSTGFYQIGTHCDYQVPPNSPCVPPINNDSSYLHGCSTQIWWMRPRASY